MVEEDARGIDKQAQLMRRITDITYCFVDDCGDYQRYTIPMDSYRGYDDLKRRAIKALTPKQLEWAEIDIDDEELPF